MPKLEHEQHIIALFNAGVLTLVSAEWYAQQGYKLILAPDNRTVVDIVPE